MRIHEPCVVASNPSVYSNEKARPQRSLSGTFSIPRLLLAASYNTSNSTEVPGKNTRNTPSILQAVTNTAAGTGRQEPQDRSQFTATSTTCFCFEWWPGKCIPQSKMSNTTGKALPSPVGESHLALRNTWELRSSS